MSHSPDDSGDVVGRGAEPWIRIPDVRILMMKDVALGISLLTHLRGRLHRACRKEPLVFLSDMTEK